MRIVCPGHRAQEVVGNLFLVHVLDAAEKAFVAERYLFLWAAIIAAWIRFPLLLGKTGKHFPTKHFGQDRLLDLKAPKFGCLRFVFRPLGILAAHHHAIVLGKIEFRTF